MPGNHESKDNEILEKMMDSGVFSSATLFGEVELNTDDNVKPVNPPVDTMVKAPPLKAGVSARKVSALLAVALAGGAFLNAPYVLAFGSGLAEKVFSRPVASPTANQPARIVSQPMPVATAPAVPQSLPTTAAPIAPQAVAVAPVNSQPQPAPVTIAPAMPQAVPVANQVAQVSLPPILPATPTIAHRPSPANVHIEKAKADIQSKKAAQQQVPDQKSAVKVVPDSHPEPATTVKRAIAVNDKLSSGETVLSVSANGDVITDMRIIKKGAIK